MKRILLIALAVFLVLSLGACFGGNDDGAHIGDKKSDYDNEATENMEIANDSGSLSIDEDTIKDMLSAYSADQTGLTADVYEYVFKLSDATFNGQAACKAEAFMAGEDDIKGVFFVSGNVCYRYDYVNDVYYLLTANDTVEVEAQVNVKNDKDPVSDGAPSTTMRTVEDINNDNNTVMHKRFAEYDLSAVGLPKAISEYDFQMTGNPVTTIDGTTAYVVYLMEDGMYTEFVFAFSPEKDYYYDPAADEYKPLS